MDDQLKSGVTKESIVGRVRQYRGTADYHEHIFLSLNSAVNSGICELVFVNLQMIERSPCNGFDHLLRFGGWPPMRGV